MTQERLVFITAELARHQQMLIELEKKRPERHWLFRGIVVAMALFLIYGFSEIFFKHDQPITKLFNSTCDCEYKLPRWYELKKVGNIFMVTRKKGTSFLRLGSLVGETSFWKDDSYATYFKDSCRAKGAAKKYNEKRNIY